MPSFIIKVNPNRDLYMLWSTIVEAPTQVGTRAEIEDSAYDRTCPMEPRFARADATGTSSANGDYGCWTDTGFIYQQQGWLRRNKFEALAEAYLTSNDPDVSALLEPFEDDR